MKLSIEKHLKLLIELSIEKHLRIDRKIYLCYIKNIT